jgi:hypothetical protein
LLPILSVSLPQCIPTVTETAQTLVRLVVGKKSRPAPKQARSRGHEQRMVLDNARKYSYHTNPALPRVEQRYNTQPSQSG